VADDQVQKKQNKQNRKQNWVSFLFLLSRFSEDVPVRPWDGKDWALYLDTLDYPPLESQYLALVGQDTSLSGTAAENWNFLSQRMR
jgi:hypothetical protein